MVKEKQQNNFGGFKVTASEEKTGIIPALIEAQKEAKHAAATGRNPMYKDSKFVPLEVLIDYVHPIFNKHGIWIQQHSHVMDEGICVETIFWHESGASMSSGKVFVRAEKQTPQGFGSAMTYCRRYSLSLATGVGGDKDDDGNAAEADKKKAPKQKERKIDYAHGGEPSYTPIEPEDVDPMYGLNFKLKIGETVLGGAEKPDQFLEVCRRHIPKPESIENQQVYKASLDYITRAEKASAGSTRRAFEEMRKAYEKHIK
tara:strand:+ start:1367 stop:2140 length:774 start_codon:yes stop_codon:yes gene_type:complete